MPTAVEARSPNHWTARELPQWHHLFKFDLSVCLSTYLPEATLEGMQNRLLKIESGISLEVQWLRVRASTARGSGSIPGWGNKILHTGWHGQIKKK